MLSPEQCKYVHLLDLDTEFWLTCLSLISILYMGKKRKINQILVAIYHHYLCLFSALDVLDRGA